MQCQLHTVLHPLLSLLLQTHTTNHSGGSHFYNCVCIEITACVPLQHWIIVSNSLQGAVGNHKFWGNLIHKHINLGLNINIWIRLFLLFSLNFCVGAIIFNWRYQPQITSCSKCLSLNSFLLHCLEMAQLFPWTCYFFKILPVDSVTKHITKTNIKTWCESYITVLQVHAFLESSSGFPWCGRILLTSEL